MIARFLRRLELTGLAGRIAYHEHQLIAADDAGNGPAALYHWIELNELIMRRDALLAERVKA